MAAAFPDEEWLQPDGADDVFEPEHWHELYFRAFDALQYDRFYGAFGGEGPISYLALSQYARDQGISGDELRHFHIFMNAVDGEWLKLQKEKADADERQKKQDEAKR